MKNKIRLCYTALFLSFTLLLTACSSGDFTISGSTDPVESTEGSSMEEQDATVTADIAEALGLGIIPPYSGEAYIAINGNVPFFTQDEITTESYEFYSDLDSLGRCGVAIACAGEDLMPTEERGDIGHIHPTGWHSVQYDFVNGGSLYNRCHLIAHQICGENDNEKNLITGTRSMNEAMIPFENMVADFIKETGNHVMYRVTPLFTGDNPVADGILMEGLSVEDQGEDVLFCVYLYNTQPGIVIDYATGDNWEGDPIAAAAESAAASGNASSDATVDVADTSENTSSAGASENTYIINKNNGKFHLPTCSGVQQMSEKNKIEYTGTKEELIEQGYEPCGSCNP